MQDFDTSNPTRSQCQGSRSSNGDTTGPSSPPIRGCKMHGSTPETRTRSVSSGHCIRHSGGWRLTCHSPAGSGRLRFQPTCGSCPDRRPLRPVRGPAASVRAGQCRANAQHTATVERYTDALFNRGAKDLTHRQRRVHADDLAAAVSDELLHTRLVVPHSILVPPHAMSAPKIRGRASSAATCQPSASREGGGSSSS